MKDRVIFGSESGLVVDLLLDIYTRYFKSKKTDSGNLDLYFVLSNQKAVLLRLDIYGMVALLDCTSFVLSVPDRNGCCTGLEPY